MFPLYLKASSSLSLNAKSREKHLKLPDPEPVGNLEEGRTYGCTECDFRSSSLADLVSHVEGHGPPPSEAGRGGKEYNCALCSFKCHFQVR